MLSVQMEQQVNLKFLVKLGRTFIEAYAVLKELYGNTIVFRGHESSKQQLSWSSIQRTLTEDLETKRVDAKFVPRTMTDNQKECRVETCRALKQQLETDRDFLSKVITGDE
ncbi:hypothetical protein NQ318_014329 [Aromia moschata]|uniref:Uncharacterized protein n=1 Tax=Aromia moschata TaxID=1265417 RepID=A0AAV8YZ18_9CUCU|nr:hypothetical protein NQ318_014329 [Aromia moschata]